MLRSAKRLLSAILLCAAAMTGLALAGAAPALALAPYWQLSTRAAPTNIAPGGEGKLIVAASNLGDEAMTGATKPIKITEKLPAGLTLAAPPTANLGKVQGHHLECTPVTLPSVEPITCEYKTSSETPTPVLQPSEVLKMTIPVKAEAGLVSGTRLENSAEVTGGAALSPEGVEGGEVPAGTTRPHEEIDISSTPTPFGVEKYELRPEEEGGAQDVEAGSHPFQMTTALTANETAREESVALPKNLRFELPPGLLGNPVGVKQCSEVDFTTILTGSANRCGPRTVIGVAEVTINEPSAFPFGPVTVTVPVFNLVPAQGEPARLGIDALKDPVILETAVRTGSDYGVVVTAKNTSQAAGFVASQVTLWGVPSDPRHNAERGWECVSGGSFRELSNGLPTCASQPARIAAEEKEEEEEAIARHEPIPVPEAFLSLPTSCSATPLKSAMQAESWERPGYVPGPEAELEKPLTGCEGLPFGPSMTVEPDEHSASTPTGLTVKIKMPQAGTREPTGKAEADLKTTTVTLPAGLQLSGGAANGLLACSALAVEFNGFEKGLPESAQTENDHFNPGTTWESEPPCPKAAKVGTVRIKTPLLKEEVTGDVYLAAQDTNPFTAPLVLYILAQGKESGVVVKLAGNVTPNPETGQLTSTFENNPQTPFEEFELHFFNGPRASQATPPLCGAYTTTAAFTPWSGAAPTPVESTFHITSGPGGGPCPETLGYTPGHSPALTAGVSNPQAGAYTNFEVTISHPDGQEALEGLTMHLPEGSAAMLSSVTPCQEPQVADNECGPESQIGETISSSGLGKEPFNLPGKVYLTGPYKGAPFGLSVVTLAKAGPFNLGYVTVRSTINVDPNTAAVTITSDPFPTIIKGVPVQLKQLIVKVNRPNFEFNPTNCNALKITGTMASAHSSVPIEYPFKVNNCGALPFEPKITASTSAHASKEDGENLNVKLESAGLGQSNIQKVFLTLPEQLPSRLTTIQKACLAAVFAANPASCDEGSVIGHATIHTPVLKNPLSGPAYLVSYGSAKFPDVEFVLQGENLTLVLDGKTDIKNGITYSRFESAPDAPFSTFETELPVGPHSALTAYTPKTPYDLCGSSLTIPTEITSQSGDVIKETTPIAVTGNCGKPASLTSAQVLAAELKKCAKLTNRSKRSACQKAARKKYGAAVLAAELKKCAKLTNRSKRSVCEKAARKKYAATVARNRHANKR